jgi:hypothetical protein
VVGVEKAKGVVEVEERRRNEKGERSRQERARGGKVVL